MEKNKSDENSPKHGQVKEIEMIKKTVKAHKTPSEELAEKNAKNIEKTTLELLEENNVPKEIIEEEKKVVVKRGFEYGKPEENTLALWEPKTKLGLEVKNNKIVSIDEIIDSNRKILEEEISDKLLNLKIELVLIGQAKGKFGGGKRRVWRQTQKKTNEGNVPAFSAMAIVGDENGHVGIGYGKAKETLPARDKATRKAKLNLIRIARGCSSFDCSCDELHTVPFKVEGKEGSVRIILIPAPQGTGLVASSELKKMLRLAGIKDVYSRTFGKKRTTFNLIKACFNALKKTNRHINKN